MTKILQSNSFLIVTCFAVFCTLYLTSERVTHNHGLGWDGVIYGDLAQNLTMKIEHRAVNDYYIRRVAPSALVYCSLKLLRLPRNVPVIIEAFSFLTLLLLTMAAFTWLLIADELRFTFQGKILGLIGLFVNFVSLKEAFVYPVLTDTPAFTLGILMLYSISKIGQFPYTFFGS